MDQQIIELYDSYTHGGIGRREFMSRLAKLVGGTQAAAMLLPALRNDYAAKPIVSAADACIRVDYLTFPGASGEVRAYHAAPEGEAPVPAVVVIHENRGLNPHIEDVARRAAAAGFWAIAPDALSPLGGTPSNEDEARSMLGQLDSDTTRGDFLAAVTFAADHDDTNGKVGCVGFCWGGAMANQLAVHSDDLSAAVAFYGRQPDSKEVEMIDCPVMLHYAGLDERINAGIEAYEAALKEAGVGYQIFMYPDVNHAFHNDTSPTRYDEEAARLAWMRTIEFFSETLKNGE
jgi:carboxymethylenebutenolidase